jgi:hypothetical protein
VRHRIALPDRLLEVAEASPILAFDVVGPVREDAYSSVVARKARSRPNVTLHGRASRESMDAYYHTVDFVMERFEAELIGAKEPRS